MKNSKETFATDIPDSPEVYVSDVVNVENGEEMYDRLLRSFIRDPKNSSFIPNVTLDSGGLMDYLKMRCSDGVNVHQLNEFWEWL